MEVIAHLRNLRISPRKVRLVADVIRGMNIHDARIQLEFLNKKSSQPVLTLMNSAIANAKHNFSLSDNHLYISKIFVNEGTTLKRWIPRAMGRASAIHKRTSHITIVLGEIEGEKKKIDTEKTKVDIKGDSKKVEKVSKVEKKDSKKKLVNKKEIKKDIKKNK